jgi:hypothetical protein
MNLMNAVLAFVIAALAAASAQVVARREPQKVLPAVNEVLPWQEVGQQPYEMTWTGREQNPHTLVDFEDLQGSLVSGYFFKPSNKLNQMS